MSLPKICEETVSAYSPDRTPDQRIGVNLFFTDYFPGTTLRSSKNRKAQIMVVMAIRAFI